MLKVLQRTMQQKSQTDLIVPSGYRNTKTDGFSIAFFLEKGKIDIRNIVPRYRLGTELLKRLNRLRFGRNCTLFNPRLINRRSQVRVPPGAPKRLA